MALAGLRKAAGTPLGKGILGVIAFTFVTWGASNALTSNANRAVAVVGDVEIDTNLFAAEYERTIRRISNERGGRVTITQAKQEGIPQSVLANMIVRQAVENHAKSIGVTTSDAQAVEEIKRLDAFKGILGEFDEPTYVNVLQQSGYTSKEFEDMVRGDVTREQMLNAVLSGMALPRSMSEAIVRNRLERRNASYIVLAPDLAGKIDVPSDEALRSYYDDHILSFTAPQYRDISFISFGPENFIDDIEIAEEEIREIYDLRKSSFTTPETRNVERLFGTEEEIIAAKARVDAGESFAEIGASMGLEAEAVILGDINEKGITDTKVAEAVFAAEAPGLIGPIEGLSWSLVRINSITPPATRSYEEARAEIREDLVLREADRTMGDAIGSIDEAIASGDSLDEIARRTGLSLKRVNKVASTGELESGRKAANLPDTDKFLEEVYASVKDFDSDLIEYGENQYFVVRVDEIYPSAPKPFETVRDEVESAWLSIERQSRLSSLATTIVNRGRSGEDFERLGSEVGRGVLQVPNGLARTQTTELFSPRLLQYLFTAGEGDFFQAPVELGESIVVMRMDGIIPAGENDMEAYVEIIGEQLDQGFVNDAERQYLTAVQRLFEARQNPESIALAIGDAPQQQLPGF